MNKIFTAGNKGDKVRSDCFISFSSESTRGLTINITSRVKSLYGKSIKKLAENILKFYGIDVGELLIEDSGALDFVIAARLEAVIRQFKNTDKEYLLPFPDRNKYPAQKDRFRISRLYLPGNSPSMMINAAIHKPHGIILDLEDSVSPSKKSEARFLVRNALRALDFQGVEKMVRINQMPAGLDDLKFVVPNDVNLILLPKAESAVQVQELESEIEKLKKATRDEEPVYIMPIIESATGIENAFSIATASKNIVAMAIGLEDYTADLGASRTPEGKESLYARMRLLNACKAAGIQAIDSVFSDVDDEEGLRHTIRESKMMGYEGMGCIHPRQIPVIHQEYAPTAAEIEKAMKIENAFLEAEEQGLGVVALGTKMIDLPVVKRARKTLQMAVNYGLINSQWRDNYEQ